ncbi:MULTISPECIES: OmpA family protein [unclassified Pseudomonas]|uniref:OmpA family protein n=1 Tax=unclassified Pseudomonas TaxID=196821 RepID=UPI0030D7AE70
MTLKLQRVLWLWAGMLALALLAIIALATWVRVVAMLIVVCCVGLGWVLSSRHAARRRGSVNLAASMSLPAASFRRPVVLVCGDDLEGLFGTVAEEQMALRVSDQGCYVRVPGVEQLPAFTESVLAVRPDWGSQLSVMLIVNPAAHAEAGVLAGHLRTFRYQFAQARKYGGALPLVLLSYLPTSQSEDPWFCWANGQSSPRVRNAGACVSVADWQSQSADSSVQTARTCTVVQLRSVSVWLNEAVLPHLWFDDAVGPAMICAIKPVPALPLLVEGSLWQQWLRNKVALDDNRQALTGAQLPFPDPVLNVIPRRGQGSQTQRASVVALWMLALTGVLALAHSAWQNTLLVRQVSDDLQRYTSLSALKQRDRQTIARREVAARELRQAGQRLDTYYRNGEPLALGLGLYRGERLRTRLWAVLANHRERSLSIPLQLPTPVRLDSLSLFSPGSAQLKPNSTKVLIDALVGIKAQPGWLIVIAGHTDATGDASQNLRLSRARAAAVHDWMQHMGGIPDSCFAVQGFGASYPIASNDTEAGRAANRRVDIRLVPEVGACAFPTAGPDTQPPVASSDS